MFVAEPLDIIVQQIKGITRGAFSCIVYPGNTVQSVAWYFRSDSGTGERVLVDPAADSDVMIETVGGVSVLVVQEVMVGREGGYHCETDIGGSILVSREGQLVLNGE